MSLSACPCGFGEYTTCCQPLHLKQTKAITAAQLMRSRYSAFAKHEIRYIVETTAVLQQQHLDVAGLEVWSKSNQWLQLEVLQAQEKINKNHAKVEFKAHYHDGESKQTHHEISYFVSVQNTWYFLDPTLDFLPTLKQMCVCGSGKKFKQCCAQFL